MNNTTKQNICFVIIVAYLLVMVGFFTAANADGLTLTDGPGTIVDCAVDSTGTYYCEGNPDYPVIDTPTTVCTEDMDCFCEANNLPLDDCTTDTVVPDYPITDYPIQDGPAPVTPLEPAFTG